MSNRWWSAAMAIMWILVAGACYAYLPGMWAYLGWGVCTAIAACWAWNLATRRP